MTLATFTYIVSLCTGITAILALAVMLIKPLRNRFFDFTSIRDGLKCQLRSDMLRTYYKHKDTKKIRQYEYQNFLYSFDAYTALKGNSFVKKIRNEVDTWEIET